MTNSQLLELIALASRWLHAAYDRPPQTPETKDMLARIDAALSAIASTVGDSNMQTTLHPEISSDSAAVNASESRRLSTLLWRDLKTDEERSNWLLLGRGYETGVVAHSIQNDVAAAYRQLALLKNSVPDLLAALKSCAAVLSGNELNKSSLINALIAARAAIEQATGETQV